MWVHYEHLFSGGSRESEEANRRTARHDGCLRLPDDCGIKRNNGETMETVTDFIFLGSKITVDGDCSHEIKKRLLLGRKSMTNLDTILKSRDITLLTKIHIVKAMVLLVVTYGCQSWTIKKVESQKLMLLNCGVGEDS